MDEECNLSEKCVQGRCFNPCDQNSPCGLNADCSSFNHIVHCGCPPSFTGNPEVECVRSKYINFRNSLQYLIKMKFMTDFYFPDLVPVSCERSSECSEGNSCRNSMCLPTCQNDNECALNEKCLRGNCICKSSIFNIIYTNLKENVTIFFFLVTCRVDNDCFLGHICLQSACQFGCHSDDDCSASESCRNNKCLNPCEHSPCGPNALCSVSNQRSTCSCPDGMVPNPTANIGCNRAPALSCHENRGCDNGWSCIEGQCRPICSSDVNCLVNERCDKISGTCKPICRKNSDCALEEVCQDLVCRIGCQSNSGCLSNKMCINSQCTDICSTPTACGTNALCSVENHVKTCSCPLKLVGDPSVACKQESVSCNNNRDCPKGLTCYGAKCQTSCRR